MLTLIVGAKEMQMATMQYEVEEESALKMDGIIDYRKARISRWKSSGYIHF